MNQAGLCKAREELDCSSNIQMIYLADKQSIKSVVYLRNRKHCPCFFQVYRNTSGRVGEREMPWQHEPLASVSAASISSKLSRACVSICRWPF